MDEYIFNIIKKNTINNKMIDSIDVIEIIDILAEKFNLENYIEKISFDVPKNVSTSFEPRRKTIIYDFDRNKEDKIKSIYIKNLNNLFAIYHEITHANQLKLISESNGDNLKEPIEKLRYRITKEFFQICKLKDARLYNFVPSKEDLEYVAKINENIIDSYSDYLSSIYYLFHDSFICEREADIEGYKYVINLLKTYDPNSNITQYFENNLRKKYLCLYSFYYGSPRWTPIKDYLHLLGYDELKSDIETLKNEINIETPDLPLDIRMEYGLDITHKEYYELENKVINERDKRLFKKS